LQNYGSLGEKRIGNYYIPAQAYPNFTADVSFRQRTALGVGSFDYGEAHTLQAKNAQLHPLISYNSSTLKEVSFSSFLLASEFYAQDHRVNEQMVFPGSGFLEMACVSGAIAGARKVCRMQDVVWIHP